MSNMIRLLFVYHSLLVLMELVDFFVSVDYLNSRLITVKWYRKML